MSTPTAARPSMKGPTIVALVLCAAFIALGVWQLWRAQLLGNAPNDEAIELVEHLQPQTMLQGDAAARPVKVTGTFDPALQVRALGGAGNTGQAAASDWDVVALRVESERGPALLAVVRGAVGAGTPLPPVPAGSQTITGRMLAFEAPGPYNDRPGEIEAVSGAELVNAWGGPMYSGYLLVSEQDTAPGAQFIPPPDYRTQWAIQNVLYAFQWWVFAGFVVYMWFKVRADRRAEAALLIGDPG